MPRYYNKIYDTILAFYESDEEVMRVDVSPWTTLKTARDSINRCIKNKRFDGVEVRQKNGRLFLIKAPILR
jgi:hypothetical protein